VFEATAQGTRTLSGSMVYYAVADGAFGGVLSDAKGHYSVPNMQNQRRVRVTAFADTTNGQLFQRSVTIATIQGDTTLDVELVARGARGITYGSPTLSGVVYRMMRNGRQPVANIRVVYKSFDTSLYDVYLETDDEGRYDFGDVQLGSGRVGVTDCSDEFTFTPVGIRGDTVLDIDVTAIVASCRGNPS
jgi:hypothetical protein